MRLLTILLFCYAGALAQTAPSQALEDKLLSRIRLQDQELRGVLGIAAIDLQTGRVIQHNGDVVFPQASSIKIPIMMDVYRAARAGAVKLDTAVTLNPGDAVAGSGHLRLMLRARPVTLTVRELITAMIETSDNTATNKLIAMVGMDSVNRLLTSLGFAKTRLQRIMLDSKAAAEDRENVSTPLEMARIAELLYRGKAVDAEASKEMIETLKLVEASFRASIPGHVPVAAKPGGVPGVHAETGIVFLAKRPFALSVMATYLDAGANPVPAIAKMVYEHFEKLANSNRYGHKLQ
jgi:beta-lactamase class A